MTDTPIENVSDTAFWVAHYRALETKRPDALFHDPLAGVLAGDHGQRIARAMPMPFMTAWAIAIRTCIVDDYIRLTLAQGVDAVLNVGAGLDTRPYRMDLYLTTHHGMNQSNAKVIVDAIHPRVSIMNNGAHKGGSPDAWEPIHNSPGLQDLWQLHYAIGSDKAHNVSEMFIANPEEKCQGKYIKVTAEPNSTFTVWNSRNNFKKT